MSAQVVSVKPVVLKSPGRGIDLQVKVSVPAGGGHLPVVVLSHGSGSSLNGYGPLADYWAAHGFAVIQPTHLDSRTLALPKDDPRIPHIWRFRVEDLKRILDNLDLLEAVVPGSFDRDRIAVAGHSFGGQTAGNLLGLRVLDPVTKQEADFSDDRVKAGVLFATAGEGGANLTPFAAERMPYLNPSFAHMSTPTLVVVGDQDEIPRKYELTVRGPDWMAEPYHLSPGRKSLLTLFGAEHSLGGITGYDVRETTDENPERVALIQHLTWAYLRHVLGIESTSWTTIDPTPIGRLESKKSEEDKESKENRETGRGSKKPSGARI